MSVAIYGVGQGFDYSLMESMQNILRDLADLSRDLNALLDTHFQGSVSKASRTAIWLILSYHHVSDHFSKSTDSTLTHDKCAVLTTRPLVMCALHMHIDQVGRNSLRSITLSPQVASFMQSCVDSAQNILRLLRILCDEDLMGIPPFTYTPPYTELADIHSCNNTDAFLPFQLEDAFSSAFVLQLLRAIAPWLLPDDTWSHDVECILNRMISKGNVVAPMRKVELNQLAQIMTPLTSGALHFQSPPQQHTNINDEGGNTDNVPSAVVPDQEGEGESSWDLFMENPMVGLDQREILDLAARLDVDSLMHTVGI